MASLSAFRFSGRLSVSVAIDPATAYRTTGVSLVIWKNQFLKWQIKGPRFFIRNIDHHPQQRSGKCFPLSVSHKRQRTATAQAVVQQKIECAEVWQLKAFYVTFANTFEVFLNSRCSHFAH